MPRFDRNTMKELKNYLYSCDLHDAEIVHGGFDWTGDVIELELYHPFFRVRTAFSFHNIDLAFATKGKEFGRRDTIYSLTVEDDLSYLQKDIPACDDDADSLYLLFQMFSGDELHIVAKEVTVDVISRQRLRNV